MVAHPVAIFNRLVAPFQRLFTEPAYSPVVPPPDDPCPLIHPEAPLPQWVEADPVVQKYRALLGDLPWADFPERPTDQPFPGPSPDPRVSFVAAYLVKLHEGKRYMNGLRAYLLDHPALVYWLGFPRVSDPSALHGFDVTATVPKRRRFSSVLRTLPNPSVQFLLTATVRLLQASLPQNQQATFGDTIAGDTQAILAWVKENNPKQYIKEGRLDKKRQPQGDPDCKLGVKSRHNTSPSDECDHPAPSSDAKPASQIQIGVDVLWGYASGIVVTRLPDTTEVVLAERTRPFNEADISHFFPLMAQVEARLGRRPRFGTWDAAYDAHYVYDYFHEAGGWAAIPCNAGTSRGRKRQFAAHGAPLCAAGLAMVFQFCYQDRTSTLIPHLQERYRCPLHYPQPTGESCPCDDTHFATGGCLTSIAAGAGSRLRYTMDREGEDYKKLYALRTMVERVNSQAEALDIIHPKLRRGRAIANHNTLTYVLINLRALARLRSAAVEARPTEG